MCQFILLHAYMFLDMHIYIYMCVCLYLSYCKDSIFSGGGYILMYLHAIIECNFSWKTVLEQEFITLNAI